MRLHEVYKDHRRDIGSIARSIVRVWEKDKISGFEVAWLTQLSSDEHLLGKLLKGSQRFKEFGGDGNEPLLDSAATFAHAYNILSKIGKRT